MYVRLKLTFVSIFFCFSAPFLRMFLQRKIPFKTLSPTQQISHMGRYRQYCNLQSNSSNIWACFCIKPLAPDICENRWRAWCHFSKEHIFKICGVFPTQTIPTNPSTRVRYVHRELLLPRRQGNCFPKLSVPMCCAVPTCQCLPMLSCQLGWCLCVDYSTFVLEKFSPSYQRVRIWEFLQLELCHNLRQPATSLPLLKASNFLPRCPCHFI